jgi:hypothetical protein
MANGFKMSRRVNDVCRRFVVLFFEKVSFLGFGCYRWISGNTYTGMWKENRREGKIGELRWANGDLYYGEWIDNKRTGVGVLRW